MITKKDLRPTLEIPTFEESTAVEKFQNEVLRPILKLQNEIFLAFYKAFLARQKLDFTSLNPEKKRNFINQSFQRDANLKNICLGLTLGMLTAEEFEIYNLDDKAYNKRIFTMLSERISSQLL